MGCWLLITLYNNWQYMGATMCHPYLFCFSKQCFYCFWEVKCHTKSAKKFHAVVFEWTLYIFIFFIFFSDVRCCIALLETLNVVTTWSITRRGCASTTPTTGASASRMGLTAPSHTASAISGNPFMISGVLPIYFAETVVLDNFGPTITSTYDNINLYFCVLS